MVAKAPHGFKRQRLAVEDNLAALFVLPVPEIARDVHPPDALFAGSLVRLADDEPDVHRLREPVVEVAVVFDVEDFPAVDAEVEHAYL